MMYDFNAGDIFQMAEQLERNGALFYRTAAKTVDDKDMKALLLKLAEMEDEHEVAFKSFSEQLKSDERLSEVFDPENDSVQYLKAFMETKVFFEKKMDTSSIRAILKDAITAEKDSIIFYLGLKDMVPEKKGRERIDWVIKEEMGHIRVLSQHLLKQS